MRTFPQIITDTRAPHHGMTLIEVLGGLGLLATLLVALLLAKGRYTHQAAVAQRRLAAVAVADALLTGWHQDPSSLVRNGVGNVPGNDGFSWRTRIIDNPAVADLDAQVIRLEILDTHAASTINPVITWVEWIVDPNANSRVKLKLQTVSKKHPIKPITP